MNDDLRKRLVERAAQVVVKLLGEYDLLFVIPPGSSRFEVINRARDILNQRGILVEVVSYRKPCGVGDLGVDELKRKLVDLLKKGVASKYVVIPRDTVSALVLAKEVKELGLVETGRICFLNIAEVYIGEMDIVEELFQLDYSHVKRDLENFGIQLKPGYGGISLTLVGRGSTEVCSKIRALTHEKTRSAERILKELVGSLPAKPSQYLVSILISVVYNLVEFALNLKPEAKLTLRVSRDVVLNLVRILLGSKRADLRDLLLEFFTKSREIAQYVDEELYEGLLDSIASHWGLTLEEFKTLIKNLARIAREEVVTVEYVERLLEEYEKRFRKIEEEIERVENELRASIALHGIYKDLENYPYIKIENGKFYIKLWREKYELATTETYLKLSDEVESKLLRERLVLIEGSSGIGKSMFSHYVIARILAKSKENGISFRVYLVSSLRSERGGGTVEGNLTRVVELAYNIGERLIVLYDPVPPDVYAKPVSRLSVSEVLEDVGRDIEFLLEVRSTWENVSVIIVLPRYMFIRVKEYFKYKSKYLRTEHLDLLEEHAIHFDERIRTELEEFVKKLLSVYSGCEDITGLATRICSEFKESYALIAKQAGLLLKARNCRVQDLVGFINEAKGESKTFIKSIVMERLGLYKLAKSVRDELMRKYAPILAIRVPFIRRLAFGWYIVTPNLMSHFMNYAGLQGSEVEKNYDWLSLRNEDLVEETLLEVLKEAVNVAPDISIPQHVDDATELLLSMWGNRIWNEILRNTVSLDCLKKLFFIIGSTFFEFGSPIYGIYENLYNNFEKWATTVKLADLKTCRELDELLVTDKRIPVLTGTLLLVSALKGLPVNMYIRSKEVDTCSLVYEVLGHIKEAIPVGLIPVGFLSYALGLSLISIHKSTCWKDAVRLLRFSLKRSSDLLSRRMISHTLAHVLSTLESLYSITSVSLLIDLFVQVKDPEGALKTVDRLLEHKNKLETWMKPFLARALSILALNILEPETSLKYFYEADLLVNEVKQHDEILGLLTKIDFELSRAVRSIVTCELDQALEFVENAERNTELVKEYTRSGLLTSELVKYLRFYSIQGPENSLKSLPEVLEFTCMDLRARVYLDKGLANGSVEYVRKAVELYKQLAYVFRGSCSYYDYEFKRLVASILAESDIKNEFFENLANLRNTIETKKKLCNLEESRVLASLVVVKALLDVDFREDLGIGKTIFEPIDPKSWLLVKLYLSVLGKSEKLDFMELLSEIEPEMYRDVISLFLLERGLRRRNYDLIRYALVRYRDVIYDLFGDETKAELKHELSEEELKNIIEKVYTYLFEQEVEKALELLGVFPDLDGVLEFHYVFELLVPATSVGLCALLLYALAEGDFKLAKAHAKLASKEFCPSFLFSELYNALEESERVGRLTKEARLYLAKVLLFHFLWVYF